MTKARKYLADATNSAGGVVYSLGGGGGGDGRPAITATAIVCGLCFSEDTSPLIKKWITFCRQHVPEPGSARMGYDEFTQYYYAQAIYQLGDDRYVALFPNSDKRERLQWSGYRKALFDLILHSQENDGSWNAALIGRVYNTSLHLSILQLDNAFLPIYQHKARSCHAFSCFSTDTVAVFPRSPGSRGFAPVSVCKACHQWSGSLAISRSKRGTTAGPMLMIS